ncbi:family 43 glycosylhydrolase [Sediminitomix flava]|uniref:Carbohydrate binding protein with CBM6 domain n=1 Tax=Sediminitomix flava TaxID=379075 RepID=A0A315Z5Z0_SEDFL|nr:family 43 glycosylhydrolase [Sediminitomix flava]PWJ37996.1 carbohydrate binding protein with CBM6 domain [Sediminitomix flava]
MKSILFSIGLSLLTVGAFAQKQKKENVNKEPYPLGNPVITHMYTADASPHVMPDGRVWMVTSVDHEDGGGYSTMHAYHTFSSSDMKNWVDHGEILHINDIIPENTTENEKDWALWAPDMIYKDGLYYLYYPVRILDNVASEKAGKRIVTSYIAVAVSDSPTKRFRVVNPKIEGTKGIDPAVFIDDDGEMYLYWGEHMAAKLADNMIELASKPVKLEVGTKRFMEAVWMNKVGEEYHISYHTKYDWKIKITKDNYLDPDRKKSELSYSVGKSPMGPFTYAGTLNYELGTNVNNGPKSPNGPYVPWFQTQSNHGGIVEFHGQEYLFYHTSALSSWRQDKFEGPGTWTQRSVCIDKLNYDKGNKIIPVQQTIEGVNSVKVKQSFEQSLKLKKAKIEGRVKLVDNAILEVNGQANVSFEKVNLGTGYYYFDLKTLEAAAYAIEIRLDSTEGELLGTIKLDDKSKERNKGVASCFLRDAKGKRIVYLVFKSKEGNKKPLQIKDLRFFAGTPLKVNTI